MKSFAIYDQEGRIVRKGRGPERAAELGLKPGEAIYWGEINPRTHFLPGGFPALKPEVTRIVAPLEVKAWAGRLLSYTDWMVVKAIDTGEPADPAILVQRQAIRDASNALEVMSPIPVDFTDPKYWP